MVPPDVLTGAPGNGRTPAVNRKWLSCEQEVAQLVQDKVEEFLDHPGSVLSVRDSTCALGRGSFVYCSPSEGEHEHTVAADVAANANGGAASGAGWGHGCRFTGGAV